MSADISQLNLQTVETPDFDSYEAPSSGSGGAPPPAGRYQGSAPDKFTYKAGNQGQLVVEMDPITIIGPTNSGKQVRFTRVSAKKYSNRNASPLGDYLKAQGVPLAGQPSPQDLADAVEQTAGRPFTFDLDWEGYDKESGETVFRSMDEFPDDGKGGKQFIVKLPSGSVVRANARIKRFCPLT